MEQEIRVRKQRQAKQFATSAFPHLDEPICAALAEQTYTSTKRSLPLNVLPDETDLRDRIYSPGLVTIANNVPMPDFMWPVDTLCDICRSTNYCQNLCGKDTDRTMTASLGVEFERRLLIRNQGDEGSCVGHALASVIDILRLRRRFGRPTGCYRALQASGSDLHNWRSSRVSARMLYEMARNYEFAPESQLSGSSVRNALKAFFHNGVCRENISQYIDGDLSWSLTLDRARDARKIRLGSYYRLQNDVLAWQAAINEVGALLVSAIIHDGWYQLELNQKNCLNTQSMETVPVLAPNMIPEKKSNDDFNYLGGHAFAVVGYSDEGFYVLNSWGDNWGRVLDSDDFPINSGIPGVAIWRYADWSAHVFDGWVFRLAHEATGEINRQGGWQVNTNQLSGLKNSTEPRLLINGHYLNLGMSGYVKRGKYPSDAQTYETTARFLQDRDKAWRVGPRPKEQHPPQEPYNALAICFMHGTAKIEKSNKQVEGLTSLFKAQRIYPIFVFWSYAELSHVENIIGANYKTLVESHGVSDRALQLRMDRELREFGQLFFARLKDQVQKIVKSRSDFADESPLMEALKPLLAWVQNERKPVHLIAHSDGALLLNSALPMCMSMKFNTGTDLQSLIKTVCLLAPSVTEADLDEIAQLRKSGTDVKFVTLGMEEEERDRIGDYPGGYPDLIQNVFFPRSTEIPEQRVLGLFRNAKDFVLTNGVNPRRRKRYHHLVASPVRGAQCPIHFDMMSNRELMRDIIQNLEGDK